MSKTLLSKFLTKNDLMLRRSRKPRQERVPADEPIQKLIPRVSDLHAPSGRPDSWEPTQQEKKLLLDSRPEIFEVEKTEHRGRKGGRGKKGSKARNVYMTFTVSAEEEKMIRAYVREQNKGLSDLVRTVLFGAMGKCIPSRYI